MSQNRDKTGEPRKLPGSWIRVPVQAIQDLSFSEYALWSSLQALCIANDHCWPTVETIGNYLGLRYVRTWALLKSLKNKGWITTEKRGRQVNYRPVTPYESLHKSEVVDSESIPESEEMECDHFTKVNRSGLTYSQKRRATLHKSEDRIIKNESVQDVPSSTAETPRRTTRKKSPVIRDPEKLQALLNAVDISPFRRDFPGINVDALFARFSDVVVNGTAKDPRPNPYDYRAFDKAFKNWCEREAKPDAAAVKEAQSTVPAAYRPLE